MAKTLSQGQRKKIANVTIFSKALKTWLALYAAK